MSRNQQVFLSIFILLFAIFWSFYGSRPRPDLESDIPETQFSVKRAFDHVENLATEPRYVGTYAHRQARNYIVSELEAMGLVAHTQQGYSVNKFGTATRPENILSRIPGTGEGEALLLLTHYDSAVHSSYGASDAASGVAVILEAVRAFRVKGVQPVNDIILMFTDAEEVGLNGAGLFVQDHLWSQDVELALNFEARGSGGNSFMLLETNGGNKELIRKFARAEVPYPHTNSLAYSVYKMLPNDTDLTVLREQGDIHGFNFAFIDDHFDYHTATDLPKNLDLSSLAHQGSYLVPLLEYLSKAPLNGLEAKEDVVFFTLPVVGMIYYPYDWIVPILILISGGLILLVGFGIWRNMLLSVNIFKGFVPLGLALLISGGLAFGLWELLLIMYPHYQEMEQGFTYNGYYYILGVMLLSFTVSLYLYDKFRNSTPANLFVAPLVIWLLIGVLAAAFLKGASYFMVLVAIGVVQFWLQLFERKWTLLLQTFLSLPALFLLLPMIVSFPVALGLKALLLSAVFTVLLFVLMWPVFSFFKKLQLLGFVSFMAFVLVMLMAHARADFSLDQPRPNSLVYWYDLESGLATWNSYDTTLDAWNQSFFKDSSDVVLEERVLNSKYGSAFKHSAIAPVVSLAKPYIHVEKKSSASEKESYLVKIVPRRPVDRLDFFVPEQMDFSWFRVQGERAPLLQPDRSDLHVFKNRWTNRLLEYYPVNQDTLKLDIGVLSGEKPKVELYLTSFDLLEHPGFNIPSRPQGMIPRPFVVNDAIVTKTSFIIQ